MLESRIKEAREYLVWSQKDLALRMHVSQPTVSNWEAGRKSPRTQIMIRLAEVLGVSFEWLTTGRGEMRPQVKTLVLGESTANVPQPERTDDETRLLLYYARLKPHQRAALLGFLDTLRG